MQAVVCLWAMQPMVEEPPPAACKLADADVPFVLRVASPSRRRSFQDEPSTEERMAPMPDSPPPQIAPVRASTRRRNSTGSGETKHGRSSQRKFPNIHGNYKNCVGKDKQGASRISRQSASPFESWSALPKSTTSSATPEAEEPRSTQAPLDRIVYRRPRGLVRRPCLAMSWEQEGDVEQEEEKKDEESFHQMNRRSHWQTLAAASSPFTQHRKEQLCRSLPWTRRSLIAGSRRKRDAWRRQKCLSSWRRPCD